MRFVKTYRLTGWSRFSEKTGEFGELQTARSEAFLHHVLSYLGKFAYDATTCLGHGHLNNTFFWVSY